jgi:hypothetical protein
MNVKRLIGWGALALGARLSAGSPAQATATTFEVQVEIKTPGGDDLGKRRISTPRDVEAAIEWAQGPTSLKLTVLVKRTPDPDCDQVNLVLERHQPGEDAQECNAKIIACGEKPARLGGEELGAPSMIITVKRTGRDGGA